MIEMRTYRADVNKKYFKQFYVGLKEETDVEWNEFSKHYDVVDTYNLGFMTPFENGKAFEKRQKTVDIWALPRANYNYSTQSYTRAPKILAIIIDNVPESFIIRGIVRRSNRTNNVLWRVRTSHNFDVEITSENMSMIVTSVGVSFNGRISVPCIWLRIGNQNHLIPKGSPVWNNYVENKIQF